MMTNPRATSEKCLVKATVTGKPRVTHYASGLTAQAFSMVELLVAMTLLSLIVLVLMAVFSTTQQAFRASVTQTDVLEGGRSTMELIASDLRGLVPSYGVSNYTYYSALNQYSYGAVNFAVTNNRTYNIDSPFNLVYQPLVQALPAATGETRRTNLLENFFILGRVNTKWTGTGYYVDSSSTSPNPLFPLYRYYAETNIDANPVALYWNFLNTIGGAQWTNMSHVMDGVVHLVVRPYDMSGNWLTNGCSFWQTNRPMNVWFSPPEWGEVGCMFYSNAVPATVEVQLGILEDRPMNRAASLGGDTAPAATPAQWSYLQGQVGHVQLFRQRVTIPSLDNSAYP
jgi:hypothetical protein